MSEVERLAIDQLQRERAAFGEGFMRGAESMRREFLARKTPTTCVYCGMQFGNTEAVNHVKRCAAGPYLEMVREIEWLRGELGGASSEVVGLRKKRRRSTA